MITAIAPGSYDPVTNGHIDVIERAAGIFDRVVVGVVGNPHHKSPMFTTEERIAFLRHALQQERLRYDLVLCDPPYDYDAARLLPQLAKLLSDDGLLVWETSSRAEPPEVPGLEQRTTRTYGSARLTLFER